MCYKEIFKAHKKKKSNLKKVKLADIPVYEHLNVSLKKTYAQRLQWLDDAVKFARLARKSRKIEEKF